MPQRFLRPGLTNSERWNSLSLQSQSFYVRILTRVDDFGRFDGRASVLLGECWSVWNAKHPKDQVDLQQVAQMLQQLAAEKLIHLYFDSEGKEILQVTQWQERVREGCKERWAAYDPAQQVAANCSKLLPPSSLVPAPAPAIIPSSSGVFDPLNVPEKLKTAGFVDAWKRWMNHRRGFKKPGNWASLFEEQLLFLGKYDAKTAEEMLRTSIRNGWQGVFEPKDNNGKPNKISGTNNRRLEGVSRNPINDYAAAAAARSKLAGQQVEAQNQSPPKAAGT